MKKFILILSCTFFASCTNSTEVEDGIPALKNLTGTWKKSHGQDTSHIVIIADSATKLIVNSTSYDNVSYKGKTVTGERVTYGMGKLIYAISYTMVTQDSFSYQSTNTLYDVSGKLEKTYQENGGGSRIK